MKKLKMILMAAAVGWVCSCSKSNLIEPVAPVDTPHKKDTLINNSIPHTPLGT